MKKGLLFVFVVIGFTLSQTILASSIREQRLTKGIQFRLEANMDPLEFVGTQILSSFRGLIVDAIWIKASSPDIRENIHRLPVLYSLISSLQPNFIESTLYAASHMAIDVATDFNSAQEQWYWMQQGLDLIDKSIERNRNHPRVWKLYHQKAYFIDQRCLSTSLYAPFGPELEESFRKDRGKDAYEVMIENYGKMVEADGAPLGYMFLYAQSYENWAMSRESYLFRTEKLNESIKAWQKTLKKHGDLKDAGRLQRLQLKIAILKSMRDWQAGESKEVLEKLVHDARELSLLLWRDPFFEKVLAGVVAGGRDLFLNLLLWRAHHEFEKASQRGKIAGWVETDMILDRIWEAHEMGEVKGAVASFEEIWDITARNLDLLQGSYAHSAKMSEVEETAQILRETADSYRKRALSAYQELLKYRPDDKEIKIKIRNLEN